MTQMIEPVCVSAFNELMDSEYQRKCDKPREPSDGWKARVNDKGKMGNGDDRCSGQRLYENMADAEGFPFTNGALPAFVERVVEGDAWSSANCTAKEFPLQAHHLIPKNYLPTHDVCAFLTEKGAPRVKVKLTGDTPYDADHSNNGYCLPYASELSDWKRTSSERKKTEIADQLMRLTRRQLHQGSHAEGKFAADEDHRKYGYLQLVDEVLATIAFHANFHVEILKCPECRSDADKPEIHPRARVVKHMDQASGVIKMMMDRHEIFVSERAHDHFRSQSPGKDKLPAWLAS